MAVSPAWSASRSEEHTSELQSPCNLVCRPLLEKKHHRHSDATPEAPLFLFPVHRPLAPRRPSRRPGQRPAPCGLQRSSVDFIYLFFFHVPRPHLVPLPPPPPPPLWS